MKFLAALSSITSLLASGLFCWLGGAYLATAAADSSFLVAGAISLLYGITSIVVIGAAWLRPSPFLRTLSQWCALAFLFLWIAASLDSWRISGLEMWSIIGAALLLFFNVAGVRIVLMSNEIALKRSAEATPTDARPLS